MADQAREPEESESPLYVSGWPRLFKRWIALSTGQITIQRISIRETNCAIHWIDFYPVDSAIQRLNNRGQMESFFFSTQRDYVALFAIVSKAKTVRKNWILKIMVQYLFFRLFRYWNSFLSSIPKDDKNKLRLKLEWWKVLMPRP